MSRTITRLRRQGAWAVRGRPSAHGCVEAWRPLCCRVASETDWPANLTRQRRATGEFKMGHGGTGFIAALVVAAVLAPGCRSVGATQEPGVPPPAPAAQGADDGHGHGSPDRVGTADGSERVVHYRPGEGFVPSRLDVETGARVVLVDETGGQLEPRFGAGQPEAPQSGQPAARSEHPEQGAVHAKHADHRAADVGSAAEHGGHEQGSRGGHVHGGGSVWVADGSGGDASMPRFVHTFETSGYWRFHNAAAPGHAALVVALTPPGEKLEPLVMELDALPSASPSEMTFESYTALLTDMEKVRESMRSYGPARTLELLRLGEVETGIDCHGSAHHLGRMAFAEYGPAAAAGLARACQSGMRHGVMEQLFVERGIANLADDVDVLCPGASDAFGLHQCFHGVGHGVMAWTAYELEDALGICDRLGDESSRRSCHSGVFMENVMSGLSGTVGQKSSYVDAEDPHYPCNALPERYVNDCYWYQTTQMLIVFNQDLGLVADACLEAPASSRRSCFGSYGRDVGGAHRRNPYLAVQYCGLPESLMHRGDCIDGAARTLFWDETQQNAGVALCAEVEEPIVGEACWQSIVNQAHAVVADLGPFCSRLPDRWRERCLAR